MRFTGEDLYSLLEQRSQRKSEIFMGWGYEIMKTKDNELPDDQ